MNVLILVASPKRRGGASRLFASVLRLFLAGCHVTTLPLRGPGDDAAAMEAIKKADAVVLAAPLYLDSAPSHVLSFLERAEPVVRQEKLHFTLYALSNNGFIEGRQNEPHLRLYESWCLRAGVVWGGGLGVGGGVMLYWQCILIPLFLLLDTLALLQQTGAPVNILDIYSNVFITLVLSAGLLIGAARLAWAIRHGKRHGNHYTRCLFPSFLFLIVADIFMLISALFHGTLPHRLFRRAKPERYSA